MKTHINLAKAQEIVASVVEGRKKWGKQYVPNIVMDDVLDALVILHEAGNVGGPTAEEVTKLKRQLAAAINREKGRKVNAIERAAEDLYRAGHWEETKRGVPVEAQVRLWENLRDALGMVPLDPANKQPRGTVVVTMADGMQEVKGTGLVESKSEG